MFNGRARMKTCEFERTCPFVPMRLVRLHMPEHVKRESQCLTANYCDAAHAVVHSTEAITRPSGHHSASGVETGSGQRTLAMMASSRSSNAFFFTDGSSWLHHLRTDYR